jgi:hypothetical protein
MATADAIHDVILMMPNVSSITEQSPMAMVDADRPHRGVAGVAQNALFGQGRARSVSTLPLLTSYPQPVPERHRSRCQSAQLGVQFGVPATQVDKLCP